MPKGEKGTKLSYDSIDSCYLSAKTDGDRVACRQYFDKKNKEEPQKGTKVSA